MKTTRTPIKHELIGKTFIRDHGAIKNRYVLDYIEEDADSGFFVAGLSPLNGIGGINEKSAYLPKLIAKLEAMREKVDMQWLADRLDLLNVSEVARQAGVPRTRIVDASRRRAQLSAEDFAAIRKVIARLS